MPRPEDAGGPAPPGHIGCAHVAFGSVHTLGVRHGHGEAVPALQGARSPLRPTGYAGYASPILFAACPTATPPWTQDSLRVGGEPLPDRDLHPASDAKLVLARERWASGAPGSGSAADAVRRRLHAVVRLLCCYAAVQREGTRSQLSVYFSHSRGSCETVQANGAVCPYVRLLPRLLLLLSPYYCGGDDGVPQAASRTSFSGSPAATGRCQSPCGRH